LNSDDDQKEDAPVHQQAATVAGLQFVLGIGLVIAVTLPIAFVYYVILPMGWNGIFPMILFVTAMLLLGRIAWVMIRQK
jgi:uncharacterized membrane protein